MHGLVAKGHICKVEFTRISFLVLDCKVKEAKHLLLGCVDH